MQSPEEQYHQLAYYTLSLQDKTFIHQHIVDAQAAQLANENTKPITLIFALVGLYLHVEKRYTGKEVQLAHMEMAKNKKVWPKIILPLQRGEITVSTVLAAPAGPQRDEMIHNWCVSVWDTYRENRKIIIELVRSELKIG